MDFSLLLDLSSVSAPTPLRFGSRSFQEVTFLRTLPLVPNSLAFLGPSQLCPRQRHLWVPLGGPGTASPRYHLWSRHADSAVLATAPRLGFTPDSVAGPGARTGFSEMASGVVTLAPGLSCLHSRDPSSPQPRRPLLRDPSGHACRQGCSTHNPHLTDKGTEAQSGLPRVPTGKRGTQNHACICPT